MDAYNDCARASFIEARPKISARLRLGSAVASIQSSQSKEIPVWRSQESIEPEPCDQKPAEILELNQAQLEYESSEERSSTSTESIVMTRHALKKIYFKGAHGLMISAPGLSLSI